MINTAVRIVIWNCSNEIRFLLQWKQLSTLFCFLFNWTKSENSDFPVLSCPIGKAIFVTYKQGSDYAQGYCTELCIHMPFVVLATHNFHLNLESEVFKGELSALGIKCFLCSNMGRWCNSLPHEHLSSLCVTVKDSQGCFKVMNYFTVNAIKK